MVNSFKRVLLSACLGFTAMPLFSQETDLFKIQDSANAKPPDTQGEPVINTFYSSRLVNSHTVELTGKGSMDFRINHRFAPINLGLYEMFGLDIASMRMGFDFGVTDHFAFGVGRSTSFKELDGYLKYRLVQQKTGGAPVSLVLLASMAYRTLDMPAFLQVTGSDRTYFTGQLLLASKLNDKTSIQVSPTYTHYNRIINFTGGSKDMISIGFLARQKISRRVSINAEYFLQTQKFDGTYNPLSIGVDINTGGHVFQLHFTNATGMNEHSFIHETQNKWNDGGIRWGFNISRIFRIGKKK